MAVTRSPRGKEKRKGLTPVTGEIILVATNALIIDEVAYDGGPAFPNPNGASMSLHPVFFDHLMNDDGAFWCSSSSPLPLGDAGTPGQPNDLCL
jgi:hypothetical protein